MNDTPLIDPDETWVCAHEDLAVVRIGGADASSFLQSKLACDTRRWRIAGGGYGVATDINGRTLFDGHFAIDDGTILTVFERSLVRAAVEHLDGYVIMEDVEIEQVDGSLVFSVNGLGAALLLGLGDVEQPNAARAVVLGDASPKVFFAPGPIDGAGRWLGVASAADRDIALQALVEAGAVERSMQAAERARIAAGIPRVGHEVNVGRTIPTEAGMWNGVSLSKGCYLGQEVLERMFSRGSAARRLVRIRWTGRDPVADGTALVRDGHALGELASSTALGDGFVGMAWLKRKALDDNEGLTLGDGGPTADVGGYVGGPDPESP